MIDPYTLSVLAFVAVVAVLIWKDRKNVQWSYGILFMRRTSKFKDVISDIAAGAPVFWKVISTIGIIICFGVMGYGLWLVIGISMSIAAGLIHVPALQLILPTASATGSSGPGYMLIPFWFWLITIFSILVPHELSHGIITRAEKLRLKSVGLLLFAIFPGAFVEPDDKQLKRAPLISQLRVYAAGSFANFMVAATVLVIATFIIWPAVALQGITVLSVNETGPAGIAGMTDGTVITSVNGNAITSTYTEYMAGKGYLFDEIGKQKPGDVIEFGTTERTYTVTAGEMNNSTYIGVAYVPNMRGDVVFFLSVVAPLLTMMWLFSFAVGLFNVLPLPALDGGMMIESIATRYNKKYGKQIARAIGLIILLIIIYDFVGPLLH